MDILTTNGITVSVETQYLPMHSNPQEQRHIFGYHILIENGSPHTVQLLKRHWVIKDGNGQVREVKGDGVIGQQPVLEPGASYAYTSFCDLLTDIGKMSGTYLMTRLSDETFFEVNIPEFKMTAPYRMN
jgi:ApaG protein